MKRWKLRGPVDFPFTGLRGALRGLRKFWQRGAFPLDAAQISILVPRLFWIDVRP